MCSDRQSELNPCVYRKALSQSSTLARLRALISLFLIDHLLTTIKVFMPFYKITIMKVTHSHHSFASEIKLCLLIWPVRKKAQRLWVMRQSGSRLGDGRVCGWTIKPNNRGPTAEGVWFWRWAHAWIHTHIHIHTTRPLHIIPSVKVRNDGTLMEKEGKRAQAQCGQ